MLTYMQKLRTIALSRGQECVEAQTHAIQSPFLYSSLLAHAVHMTFRCLHGMAVFQVVILCQYASSVASSVCLDARYSCKSNELFCKELESGYKRRKASGEYSS